MNPRITRVNRARFMAKVVAWLQKLHELTRVRRVRKVVRAT
jgi:hypothetical protein